MNGEHASAWDGLIEDWAARESRMRPESPIKVDSLRVRDSIEHGDNVYVLVSYDVEYPWPQEEDTPAQDREVNTAVLQARRVRTPWVEKDVTRALAWLTSDDDIATVSEHVLGPDRAFSGHLTRPFTSVTLRFEDGSTVPASVVEGWFLSVVPEALRIVGIVGHGDGDDWQSDLHRDDVAEMISAPGFARTAGPAMYFSPLDLRAVLPLVRWARQDNIVVVASSIEQYDEGGVVRLRIDGVRTDDDVFTAWPKVSIDADGMPLASAVCGEFGLADTLTMDIGFRPWRSPEDGDLSVTVRGLRGPAGTVDAITVPLAARRLQS